MTYGDSYDLDEVLARVHPDFAKNDAVRNYISELCREYEEAFVFEIAGDLSDTLLVARTVSIMNTYRLEDFPHTKNLKLVRDTISSLHDSARKLLACRDHLICAGEFPPDEESYSVAVAKYDKHWRQLIGVAGFLQDQMAIEQVRISRLPRARLVYEADPGKRGTGRGDIQSGNRATLIRSIDRWLPENTKNRLSLIRGVVQAGGFKCTSQHVQAALEYRSRP